jgi:hypothetical protein
MASYNAHNENFHPRLIITEHLKAVYEKFKQIMDNFSEEDAQ